MRTSKQEYRCYGGYGLLYLMEEISSEQIRLRAVQLKGQDNDDRKWIKWRIALQPSADENRLFTCTPFIGMQIGGFYYRLQPMVEFSPCYPEEPHKFTLCHGYLSVSLANDLHIATPIKIAAMIGSVCSYFWIVICLHAVSSILQVTIFEDSQASLSEVSFSFADCLAMSLSISSDIFLSVTWA